eukprot:GEMP01044091.1.p2 GENE.GEMP01044091.1~~GEMP01044091.1.p2  ORF type:complete len:112 (+),score=15.27 GEMP01044091.1:111-446(+)
MSDGIGRSIDWNINFFAFKTEDLDDLNWSGIAQDDEAELSFRHPAMRNQHCAALGRAVVVHYTFTSQEKGLLQNTTLEDRYRELAEPLKLENAVFYHDQTQPEHTSRTDRT